MRRERGIIITMTNEVIFGLLLSGISLAEVKGNGRGSGAV